MRDRFREETTLALLIAAESVFARDGLHLARMEAVAEAAGVSVGTIYNYFQDRDALIRALIEHRLKEFNDRFDRILDGLADRPFAEQLRAFIEATLVSMDSNRNFLQLLLQDEQVSGIRVLADGIDTPRHAVDEIYTRVRRLIARGAREGVLRPAAIDLLPALLLGILRGLLLYVQVETPTKPLQLRTDEIVRFLLEGAGAQTTARKPGRVQRAAQPVQRGRAGRSRA